MENTIQDLYLKLIERTKFNNFDGPKVAEDLKNNKELWDSVLMINDDLGILLRDLSKNYNNADTLLVLTTKERLPKLLNLCFSWRPDNVAIVDGEQLSCFLGSWMENDQRTLVILWWD